MAVFNWQTALLGGSLIGIAATVLLLFNGRIAGISGMVNGAISFTSEEAWRWVFIVGILLGAAIYEYGIAAEPTPRSTRGAVLFDRLSLGNRRNDLAFIGL